MIRCITLCSRGRENRKLRCEGHGDRSRLTDREFTWTPYNFEGFYYDIDDDVGTEKLQVTISGGNKIDEKDLVYTTSPQQVEFEFEDWGKYDVIGFMADKYFAGYNNRRSLRMRPVPSMKAS